MHCNVNKQDVHRTLAKDVNFFARFDDGIIVLDRRSTVPLKD